MSSTRSFTLVIVIFAMVSIVSHGYDPDPLQDFCVGVTNPKDGVFVNGKICKDPNTVTIDDFVYEARLNIPRNITASVGSKLTPIFVDEMPGLNTLGISMVRIDFAPNGLNAPHEHPHASEILLVLSGTLYAGFIQSNPLVPNVENKLFAKTLNAGDVIVFPKGLIHFQYNVGKENAVAIAALGSQNPGVVTIGLSMFGSVPPVLPSVLAKGFQIDEQQVTRLQSLTWEENI